MLRDDQTSFKSRRVTQACDYCHRRSKRCKPCSNSSEPRCQNCVDFGQSCTYERPVKRRGVQSSSRRSSISNHSSQPQNGVGYHADEKTAPSTAIIFVSDDEPWTAPHVASQAVIVDLVEIYFEVIYPIFPFFHRPTFLRKVSRGEYATNRYLFAVTMAVCALASARVRDGALYAPHWQWSQLQEPKSDTFFVASQQAILVDLTTVQDYNLMRAYALLALVAIQNGQVRSMYQFIGHYHTLVAIDGLHDESNWPKSIGFVEREERRRLFWSIYTLDVYSSIVWSGVIRCREGQSDVAYPVEVDDELFDDEGVKWHSTVPPPSGGPSPHKNPRGETSWLSGWNFTTDLYRILEHACQEFRSQGAKVHRESFLHDIFGSPSDTSQAVVLESVMVMYANLPLRFKQTNPITLDMTKDRFGFQAANITATMQLLRMVLFAAGGATIEQRCQVASEVVNSFLNVPIAYLRAISSPLLHHLAGIGSILGSVFEEPLSEAAYLHVRTVLLSMAQLLANLDLGLNSTASASERLRSQVARIDQYMEETQRQSSSSRKGPQQEPESSYRERKGSNTADATAVGYDQQVLSNVVPTDSVSLTEGPASQYQLPPELFYDWPWTFASNLDFSDAVG